MKTSCPKCNFSGLAWEFDDVEDIIKNECVRCGYKFTQKPFEGSKEAKRAARFQGVKL
jgi:Zn ribbon nucleic-acid-binding protein